MAVILFLLVKKFSLDTKQVTPLITLLCWSLISLMLLEGKPKFMCVSVGLELGGTVGK